MALNALLVFPGAGSIRKMPEDASLVSLGTSSGSLAEEDTVIAVAFFGQVADGF